MIRFIRHMRDRDLWTVVVSRSSIQAWKTHPNIHIWWEWRFQAAQFVPCNSHPILPNPKNPESLCNPSALIPEYENWELCISVCVQNLLFVHALGRIYEHIMSCIGAMPGDIRMPIVPMRCLGEWTQEMRSDRPLALEICSLMFSIHNSRHFPLSGEIPIEDPCGLSNSVSNKCLLGSGLTQTHGTWLL
jgi:hypothetical protein